MGRGRYLLLGDFGQQLDLSDLQVEFERLRQKVEARSAAPSDDRLRALQRENDELKLYLAAVIRLLVAKGVARPRRSGLRSSRSIVGTVQRTGGTPGRWRPTPDQWPRSTLARLVARVPGGARPTQGSVLSSGDS